MRNPSGFSLFEILTTLVIIGILAGLCLPLYSQHLTTERRLEAKIALEKLAATLENYYTTHNTYRGTTLEQLGISAFIAKNNYQLSITALTDTTFSLAAKPLANQAQQDSMCGTLLLNAVGEKNITGSGKIADCWE